MSDRATIGANVSPRLYDLVAETAEKKGTTISSLLRELARREVARVLLEEDDDPSRDPAA